MACSKREFQTEIQAEEALIQSHILFTSTAINYYKCDVCDQYHLTSKGNRNPILDNEEVKQKIKREQQSHDWGF